MTRSSRLPRCGTAAAAVLVAVLLTPTHTPAQQFTATPSAETTVSPADVSLVAQGVVSARLGREDTSYHVQDGGTGYQASNPRHGFAASFSRRGLVVRAGEEEWRLAYVRHGDGEGRAGGGDVVAPTVRANRVEYRRGALTEWYVNGPLGLQQGFTVHRAVEADATELSLRLAIGGSMAAVVDADGRGLALRPAALDAQHLGRPARHLSELNTVCTRVRRLNCRMLHVVQNRK